MILLGHSNAVFVSTHCQGLKTCLCINSRGKREVQRFSTKCRRKSRKGKGVKLWQKRKNGRRPSQESNLVLSANMADALPLSRPRKATSPAGLLDDFKVELLFNFWQVLSAVTTMNFVTKIVKIIKNTAIFQGTHILDTIPRCWSKERMKIIETKNAAGYN